MHSEHPGQQPAPTHYAQPQAVHYPHPQGGYYPPRGYWQPKAPSSGLRIATGVLALTAAVVGILMAGIRLFVRHGGASTPFNGWMNYFLIVGSIGCLVTGIVILAKQRKQGGATPWLVTSFAGLTVISCLGFMATRNAGLPGATFLILPPALATLVLAILVTVKGQHRATQPK